MVRSERSFELGSGLALAAVLVAISSSHGGTSLSNSGSVPAIRAPQRVGASAPTSSLTRKARIEAAQRQAKERRLREQKLADQATLTRIIAQLDAPDANLRGNLARALGRRGADAYVAVPYLVPLLSDAEPPVRVAAGWALEQIARSIVDRPERLTAEEQQDCLVYFQESLGALASVAGQEQASIRIALTAARNRLSPLTGNTTEGTAAPSLTLRRPAIPAIPAPISANPVPRSVPAPAPRSVSKTNTAQLEEQLRAALSDEDVVEVYRNVQALRNCSDEGVRRLLAVLAGAPMRPLETLIEQALVEEGARTAPHLKNWLETLAGQEHESAVTDRYRALRLLQNLGPEAARLVPDIVTWLGNWKDSDDRCALVGALQRIGPAAALASPDLIETLRRDGDAQVQAAILLALEQAPHDQPALLAALRDLVRDHRQDFDLRLDILERLVVQHAEPPEIAPLLVRWFAQHAGANDEDDWALRGRLLKVLRLLGKLVPRADASASREIVSVISGLLDQEDSELRYQAAQALVDCGPRAAPALPALIRRIRVEPAPDVFRELCGAIRAIGDDAIADLVVGVNSFDQDTRMGTCRAILELGPAARCALGRLERRALEAETPEERAVIIRAMAELGPDPAADLSQLSAWALDPRVHLEVRRASVLAVGRLSCEPTRHLPELVPILHETDAAPEIRAAAVAALTRDWETFAPELNLVVTHGRCPVSVTAACQFVRRGKTSPRYLLPLLEAPFDHPLSSHIHEILEQLPESALPSLEELAGRVELGAETRRAAVRALGGLGSSAVPALLRLVSRDETVANAAVFALQEQHRDVLPVLIAELETVQKSAPKSADHGAERESAQSRLMRAINGLVTIGQGGPVGGGMPAAAMAMAPAARAGAAMADGPAPKSPLLPSAQPVPLKKVRVYYGTNRQAIDSNRELRSMLLAGFVPSAITLTLTLGSGIAMLFLTRRRAAILVLLGGTIVSTGLAVPGLVRAVKVRRFVATRPGPMFGTRNAEQIAYGSCVVSIPSSHQSGELEGPSLLKLQINQDPTRHIIVESVASQDRETFLNDIRSTLGQTGENLLVFIHGYNVDFDDAARRTAQMANDLHFVGAPVFFSWPSQGNWHLYRTDEQQVELSVEYVRDFLLDLARNSGAKSIHLVAHSMGTRALTAALSEIRFQSPEVAQFNQVILAAPDINAEIFRKRIAPRIVGTADRITLYASSNDRALLASEKFNAGGTRAGDSSRPVIVPGIETVDVSQADTSLLGHSYYGSNATVLTDIRELVHTARPASQRPGLIPSGSDEQRYWSFRLPDAIAHRPAWRNLLRYH